MAELLEKFLKQVKSNITEISKEELIEKINSNEDIVICDVRSTDTWQEGHIPGAINCDRGLLEIKIEKMIPDTDQEVITCCGGGTRSAFSAESLQRMGYKNVKSLAGGYKAWVNAGLPVENS